MFNSIIDYNKQYHMTGKGINGGDLIFVFEYESKDVPLSNFVKAKLENYFKELQLIN